MERRDFIEKASLASLGVFLPAVVTSLFASRKKNPVILLVSGWQDVNIGDIGHTPGLLHVLETFLPQAKIILWKKSNGAAVKKLLNTNFPKVNILYGGVNAEKDVSNPEIMRAFEEADLMIHGSGPLLVGADNLACWMKHTSKPFGVFGTTLQAPSEYHQGILKKAAFILHAGNQVDRRFEKSGHYRIAYSICPRCHFLHQPSRPRKSGSIFKRKRLGGQKIHLCGSSLALHTLPPIQPKQQWLVGRKGQTGRRNQREVQGS